MSTRTIEAVARQLGVPAVSTREQLLAVIEQQQNDVSVRRQSTPVDALRSKYDQRLLELRTLKEELEKDGRVAQSARQHAPADMTATQFQDLPSVAARSAEGAGRGEDVDPESMVGRPLCGGRYVVERVLGQGGMGVVYAAQDTVKREKVALKVLAPWLVNSDSARDRLVKEVQISTRLRHENIVNVFDLQTDGDWYLLAMELLRGENLRERLDRLSGEGQPFDAAEALRVSTDAARALAHAHSKSVLHRDIKPDNLFMSADGPLKVMDFGIARVETQPSLTRTGFAMGTAMYMAPEQHRKGAVVDHRADQYALGVTIYEALTGQLPAGRMRPVRELRPDVGKDFAQIIERLLSPEPDGRYASTGELVEALERVGRSPSGLRIFGVVAAIVFVIALGLVAALATSEDLRVRVGLESAPVIVEVAPEPEPIPVADPVELATRASDAEAAQRSWQSLREVEPPEIAEARGMLVRAQALSASPETSLEAMALYSQATLAYQARVAEVARIGEELAAASAEASDLRTQWTARTQANQSLRENPVWVAAQGQLARARELEQNDQAEAATALYREASNALRTETERMEREAAEAAEAAAQRTRARSTPRRNTSASPPAAAAPAPPSRAQCLANCNVRHSAAGSSANWNACRAACPSR